MADFINACDDDELKEIFAETQNALQELLEIHPVRKGELFVIGCSSSEIAGGILGKNSSEEIGKTVYAAASEICIKNGLFLAAQCCEHLNRALVIEEKLPKNSVMIRFVLCHGLKVVVLLQRQLITAWKIQWLLST